MTTKLLLQSGLLNMTSANRHPQFPLSLGHCRKPSGYHEQALRSFLVVLPEATG